MPTITNSSNSSLLIIREDSPGVLPDSLVYKQLRFTGSTLGPSLQTEVSDEITPQASITDLIPTRTEAGGDTSHELSYGTDTDLLLEFALRNRFVSDDLKGGSLEDTASFLQVVRNKLQNFVFKYSGCKVESLAMNIGADNAKDNYTLTWMSKEETLLPQYFVFTDTAELSDLFGREGAIMIESDGTVHQYSDYAWADTGYTFTSGATWTVTALAPTGGSDGDWHLNTATGQFSTYVTDEWIDAFIVLPENTTWFSGVIPPVAQGDKDDGYIDTNTGFIYQKIFNGETSEWVQVGDVKITTNPTGFYYQGITVSDFNESKIMSFPNVQDVNIAADDYYAGLENEAFCFDDFTFNISNNTERIYGLCTDRTEYPNLGSIGTTSGQRNVTGNLSLILGNNITLYEMMLAGTPIAYDFIASDGTNGYKFSFPKTKFSDGNVNPSGNNEAVKIPFTWQALLSPDDGTEIIISKTTL